MDWSVAYLLVNLIGGGIREIGKEATTLPIAVKYVLTESSNTARGVSMTAQFWRCVDRGDADDPRNRTCCGYQGDDGSIRQHPEIDFTIAESRPGPGQCLIITERRMQCLPLKGFDPANYQRSIV